MRCFDVKTDSPDNKPGLTGLGGISILIFAQPLMVIGTEAY